MVENFIPKTLECYMYTELKGILLVLRIASGFLSGYLLASGLDHILRLFF